MTVSGRPAGRRLEWDARGRKGGGDETHLGERKECRTQNITRLFLFLSQDDLSKDQVARKYFLRTDF